MKIGVLGTGMMGFPAAERLSAQNYDVIVWNRTREKAIPLKSSGVAIAVNARHCDRIRRLLLTVSYGCTCDRIRALFGRNSGFYRDIDYSDGNHRTGGIPGFP